MPPRPLKINALVPCMNAHPGRYACRLLLDGDVLHETVFFVAQL